MSDLNNRAQRLKQSFLAFAGEAAGITLEAGKLAYDKGREKYVEYQHDKNVKDYEKDSVKQPDTGEHFPAIPGIKFSVRHRARPEEYVFVSLNGGTYLKLDDFQELTLAQMRDYTRHLTQ